MANSSSLCWTGRSCNDLESPRATRGISPMVCDSHIRGVLRCLTALTWVGRRGRGSPTSPGRHPGRVFMNSTAISMVESLEREDLNQMARVVGPRHPNLVPAHIQPSFYCFKPSLFVAGFCPPRQTPWTEVRSRNAASTAGGSELGNGHSPDPGAFH